MKKLLLNITFTLFLLLAVTCSHQSTSGGGGSEVEVVGSIYLSGSTPAPATEVKLIPYDYDPSSMAAIGDYLIDTSDEQGNYAFRKVAPGVYNVQAVQLRQRTRLLVTGIQVDSQKITLPPETLHEPGVVQMLLFNRTKQSGYATIPGTDIAQFVAAGSSEIVLDSVPVGTLPEIRYKARGDTGSIVTQNVKVTAADTTKLSDPSWLHKRTLQLNTTATGADVKGDVAAFPVLVRLTEENFGFSQAAADGSDIRFASSRGKMLPFEIEAWNRAALKAAIWVLVDTVFGNDSLQYITMHWGPSTGSGTLGTLAIQEFNGSTVFDTAAGFAGVWHLGASAEDATVNHFTGSSPDSATPEVAQGIIGEARAFDGEEDFIVMPNTASGALDFPEDGYFSVSAWVYADTFDQVFRTIMTKGYEQYFLQLSYFPGDKPLWQFSTFTDNATWNMSHTAATEKQWMLLTGVRQGSSQSLYCNGDLVLKSTSSDAVYTHPDVNIPRNTSNDFSIGRFLKDATFPTNFGTCFFKGTIDEVRVCRGALSADWIKLCYMNQRSDDKLLKFR